MATNWPRVGDFAKARRKELKITQEGIQELEGPSPALVRQIEKKTYNSSMGTSLKRGYERALQWQGGSIDAIHEGGEPTPLDVKEALLEGEGDRSGIAVMRSTFNRLADEADAAQAEFERLAAELAAAEAKVDATNRQVFHYLALENNLQDERQRREAALGRPLTKIEWLAIDSVERPSPYQVAELTATHATMDPHEWTRYEMALVERFEAPYTRDVTHGSRFADLSVARALVARIPGQEGGTGHGESPAQKTAEELQQEAFRLAANRGEKEPDDESQ